VEQLQQPSSQTLSSETQGPRCCPSRRSPHPAIGRFWKAFCLSSSCRRANCQGGDVPVLGQFSVRFCAGIASDAAASL